MKFVLFKSLVVTAGLAVMATAGAATTMNGYTSVWMFGDSLSDPGNFSKEIGGAIPPSPPYYQGKFSNGPVWADKITDDFTAAGRPSGNFAYGFGTAVRNDDVALGRPRQIPDVPDQIELFKTKRLADIGDRPIGAIWAGANDIFNAAPGGTAKQAGRAAAKSVARNAMVLADLGFKDVAIFNLPDLSKTPSYKLFQPALASEAAAGAAAFNSTIARRINKLEAKGLNVVSYDMASLFDDLIANPTDYGVQNAMIPCVFPEAAGGSVCSPEEALALAFFDSVHPNSVIHGRIGDIVAADIAPVPLPGAVWLILVGTAGLVLVSRRRGGSAAV